MLYTNDPYYGGFPLALDTVLQEMTPVVIDFRAAVLGSIDEPIFHKVNNRVKPKYTLRISPPRSVRRGIKQHIADSIVYPIPEDGVVRFKLAPSNLYSPRGRYIVEFYRRGCQIPIDVQQWLVPAIPKQLNYTFSFSEVDTAVVLPLYVWQINSVSPASEFLASWNSLMWTTENRPSLGTVITATYTPAVTLDQLMEYKVQDFEGVTRIRR